MTSFDPTCRACPRLSDFLDETREQHPGYFCAPVPPFGVTNPQLLIVGLAPGMHGANRTGRPFTGDHAGILLYETLHETGFANRSVSISADDELQLIGCRITNAVKCLPPANKPETSEIARCNEFLKTELMSLKAGTAVLALGQIAHVAILKALGLKLKDYPFAHGAHYSVTHRGIRLYDSYHCSRYNTQTKRLTPAMFKSVFNKIRLDNDLGKELASCPSSP